MARPSTASARASKFGGRDGTEATLRSRRSFPTDYDRYAPTYAWARAAVPWVADPLAAIAATLAPQSTVLEIGCGTGNYIHAIATRRSDLRYVGFDLSEPMLRQARARPGLPLFLRGDATRAFPCAGRTCAMAFMVDVIHHLEPLDTFFSESARVLAPHGRLVIVTDSEGTMRRRSLTRFVPELMSIELDRYPDPSELHRHAAGAGLRLVSAQLVEGRVPLTDEFVKRLGAKCSSAMRLIGDAEHGAGMARVREGQARGEEWLSCYEMLHYAA